MNDKEKLDYEINKILTWTAIAIIVAYIVLV